MNRHARRAAQAAVLGTDEPNLQRAAVKLRERVGYANRKIRPKAKRLRLQRKATLKLAEFGKELS